MTKDSKDHIIMIMGSIQQEAITLTNIYAPNVGAPSYVKQILSDIKEKTTIKQS